MEMVVPYSEVVLAAAIQATLQLGLAALLLLYHASLSKHVRKKTKRLVSSYIAGMGFLVFLSLGTIIFILDRYFNKALYPEELVIVISMLVALAIASWFFYYRRGKTTELWLPRNVARYIDGRAKLTNSNAEAFSLGMLTTFAEMPFSIILLVVAANSILKLPLLHQIIAVAVYALITVIPSIVLRLVIRRGKNVVAVQRWRVKNKMFFRILTGAGFLALGFFLFGFEVL